MKQSLVLALALRQKPTVCEKEISWSGPTPGQIAFALNSVRLFGHTQLMMGSPWSSTISEDKKNTIPPGISQNDFDTLKKDTIDRYRAFTEMILLMSLPGEKFSFKLTVPSEESCERGEFARVDVWLE